MHLKNIYYATFSSNLFYGSQVWTQSSQAVMNKISLLQRKAVRILTFSNFRDHTEPLFKELEILKVRDNIFLQNCLFVYDYFHDNLPDSFKNTFNKVDDIHSLLTRNANDGSLALPRRGSRGGIWGFIPPQSENYLKCLS